MSNREELYGPVLRLGLGLVFVIFVFVCMLCLFGCTGVNVRVG